MFQRRRSWPRVAGVIAKLAGSTVGRRVWVKVAAGAAVEKGLTLGGTGVVVGDGVNVADGVNRIWLAGLQPTTSNMMITRYDKRTTFLFIFLNSRKTDGFPVRITLPGIEDQGVHFTMRARTHPSKPTARGMLVRAQSPMLTSLRSPIRERISMVGTKTSHQKRGGFCCFYIQAKIILGEAASHSIRV